MTNKEMKDELSAFDYLELKEYYSNTLNSYNKCKEFINKYGCLIKELDMNDSLYERKILDYISFLSSAKKDIKYYDNIIKIINRILPQKMKEYQENNSLNDYISYNNNFINKIKESAEELKQRFIKVNEDKIIDEEINESFNCMIKETAEILKDRIGNIKEIKNLHINNNKGFDGIFIGDLNSIEIDTILAGGYNIQKLHYRILVKEL